jgi:hypothetical protein
MFSAYTLLKFVHVAAAIVGVGGAFAMTLLNALLTLLAGIGLVTLTGGHMALWTGWGLVGVFGSLLLGAVLIGRTSRELALVVATPAGDAARAMVLRGRLATYGMLNLLILFSTVAVMVLKPSL